MHLALCVHEGGSGSRKRVANGTISCCTLWCPSRQKKVTTNHGAQHFSENFVIRLVREKGGLSCVRGKKGGEKMLPISDPAFRMLKEVTRALPDHVPGWRGLADHNGPPRSVEFWDCTLFGYEALAEPSTVTAHLDFWLPRNLRGNNQ